ncbi:MAG: hypothetical protein WC735_03985 [Candidatus Paceibacterota bacterium]|jgi:hypothetical protein
MNLESTSPNINKTEKVRNKIKAELKGFGVPEIPEIVDHLVVLEENSRFNDDSRMILEGIGNVLDLIDSFKLTTIQRKRLFLATYLGDIGKTSSSKDTECQLAVARLFSKENLDSNQKVTRVLQLYFPAEEVDPVILNLFKVGIGPDTLMPEFWRKHAFWTQEILDRHQDVFDKSTRTIAASHHINSGIDPYKIRVEGKVKGTWEWEVSNEEKFSILLFMAMDKYQAFIVRSKKSHKEAIKLLKDELKPFDGDDLKDMIVRAIEQLGGTDSVFPEGLKDLKAKKDGIIK